MKNKNANLDINQLGPALGHVLKKFTAYRIFLFFLLVAGVYGFIIWRINVYSDTPPSVTEETAQQTAQPRIDQATVDKIQSLQDNSVNVQSLFSPDRQNPFN